MLFGSALVLQLAHLTIIVYENECSSISYLISSGSLGTVPCCTVLPGFLELPWRAYGTLKEDL